MTATDPKRPIRIAFGITDLDVGGAENALCEIVTRLDREAWDPAVFCLSGPGANVERLEGAGVPVICLGARGSWDLRTLGRLTKTLREWSPRLLQTFLFHANILGRIAGRRAGVERIISGVRVADRRGAWRHWIDRVTAAKADHHVCVSRAVAEFAKQSTGIAEDRLSVIPNGVDFERFAKAEPANLVEFGIPRDAPVLLFVGRLDPQKDPELAITAFEQLAVNRPDWHFLMVGRGPMESELQSRCSRSSVASRIHLAGQRSDVPELMRASALLVLPSRFEGMPNVVLEAMAAGLPTIVSEVEGVREVVEDHRTGWLVEPGSDDSLVQALAELMDDEATRSDIGCASQESVAKGFTWGRVVREYEAVFREILEIDSPSTR